jgi:hypothetical protein
MQLYDNAVQFSTDNEEIDDSNVDDIIEDMSCMLTFILTTVSLFFTFTWPTLPPAKDAALWSKIPLFKYGQRCHQPKMPLYGQRYHFTNTAKKLPLHTTSYLFIHHNSYKNILANISLESPHSYIARRTTSYGRVGNNQRNVHLAHV